MKIYVLIILLTMQVLLPGLSWSANSNDTHRAIGIKLKDRTGHSTRTVQLYSGSYALLIGVEKYTYWPQLNMVPSELDKVEAVLEAKGFSITRVDNPDSTALENAFENFIDTYGYKKENRLLFFFSGHGHTRHTGESCKGYLVPVDAPSPLNDITGFLSKSLSMSKILSWSRDIEARHALFLFDSCFSGTVFTQKALPMPDPYITELTTKPVRQYITAGSADESVPAQSTFTPMFVDALKYGKADLNKDGYIQGEELGLYLGQKVPHFSNQHPQHGKIHDYALSRGDFIFLSGVLPKQEEEEKRDQEASLPATGKPSGNTGATVNDNNQAPEEAADTLPNMAALDPRKGRLIVSPEPVNARVRILNIHPVYRSGMELAPGEYAVEVSAFGYTTHVQHVRVHAGETLFVKINLDAEGCHTDPSTGMEFVFVQGGCYQMGNSFGKHEDDETPIHEVCVDGFYMGKYEVTQGQWQQIMGNNPASFQRGSHYPVENVSWDDTQTYIRTLSRKSKITYRLPTEAEWEYAARSSGKQEKYAGSNVADLVAWYGSNEGTHVVGQKQANGLGLYDMSGNVWEWCSDWYDRTYYSISPQSNPQGPASGSSRVNRGGGWFYGTKDQRSANRSMNPPSDAYDGLGFRLVFPAQ